MSATLRDSKFEIGFFSFTEITDPNEHRSYNEWHMLDHMPEQFPIPGIVYGQRWVSTPACTAARAVSDGTLDPVHYLTWYVMTEPVEATLREFYAHGRALAKVGRFHQHRRALLSGPFRIIGGGASPRVLVRAESVPFRPHRGIYVVVEVASASNDDPTAHTAALMDAPEVAGWWAFASDDQRITVAWIDGDPLAAAVALAPVEAARSGVNFAGPFETITPWQWDWFD